MFVSIVVSTFYALFFPSRLHERGLSLLPIESSILPVTRLLAQPDAVIV